MFIIVVMTVDIYKHVVHNLMFCSSLFASMSFFFWPLCCLSLFVDLRILITPLVSSNSSPYVLFI